MGHRDIAKTIISSNPLSIRKNKIKPFSKEPEKHLEKFLRAQILVCIEKWVSLVGQFNQMSEICFLDKLIHSFIMGSNIQKIQNRICCYWQLVTELDCIKKTRTGTGFFGSMQWSLFYPHHVKKKQPPQFFGGICHDAITVFIHVPFCIRRSPRDFSYHEKSGVWWFGQFNCYNPTSKDLVKLFINAKCFVKVHRLYSPHHTYWSWN